MTKIIFVDLDGTIREPITGKFVDSPQNQRIIPGADKAINHFAAKGWLIIGISNQGGVELNYKSLYDCIEEMQYTLQLFPKLDSIYFCPDMAGNDCVCITQSENLFFSFVEKEGYIKANKSRLNINFRKPSTGMLRAAIEYKLRVRVEEFVTHCEMYQNCDCWMIGDRAEDEKAAENLEIKFMPAESWRNHFIPGMFTGVLSIQEQRLFEDIQLN